MWQCLMRAFFLHHILVEGGRVRQEDRVRESSQRVILTSTTEPTLMITTPFL
jgi:hypothetical protein